MTHIEEEYRRWLEGAAPADRAELESLASNEAELHDAFYRELSFGTAGLRGIIGLGPNRMNVYTVGKATQGFADYLNAHFENPSVAIARDSRNGGEDFVRRAACVLAANGINALVYREIEPTPALSFAVRDLGCAGGINVTASHNPAAYNGYKAYGADGCQIASDAALEIQESIDRIDVFDDVKCGDFDELLDAGKISWIGDDTIDRFLDAVEACSVEPAGELSPYDLKVVYTPLNGTGLSCVKRILARVGVRDVTVVPEQEMPDGDFPTCPYPNPEMREALQKGLELCERVHPDLLLATDPDADRVGIAVPHGGDYVLLSGNEVGCLLIDYLFQRKRELGDDLSRAVVVTTIVSSLMPDALARDFGFELRRVLTGFKYIGGQIARLESSGEEGRFAFGFEESYGYLSGSHVRDKDAVNASMLICQMARWHKGRGRDLVEAMNDLYARYGYYLNRTISVEYPGESGAREMAEIMEGLREHIPETVAGMPVAGFSDYAGGAPMPEVNGTDPQTLPEADVVSLELGDGTGVLVRPSGTEPKIKAYLFAKAGSREKAGQLLDELEKAARSLLRR